MKKIIIIALIIAILAILVVGACGCGIPVTSEAQEDDFEFSDRFIIIGKCQTEGIIYFELYDKNTKVMYVYMYYGSSGSLTLLVNANGTPMLYEENK